MGHTKRSTQEVGKVGVARLGSLKVRDLHTGIEFKCGFGGTEQEAKALWAMREQLIGKVIVYKFQKGGGER